MWNGQVGVIAKECVCSLTHNWGIHYEILWDDEDSLPGVAHSEIKAVLYPRNTVRFQRGKIPFQTLETNDQAKVAIVFERVNRKGIPLDTYQLFVGLDLGKEFDLEEKFDALAEDLKPYGFEEVGDNINLLLSMGSAILTMDGSTSGLINLKVAQMHSSYFRRIASIAQS